MPAKPVRGGVRSFAAALLLFAVLVCCAGRGAGRDFPTWKGERWARRTRGRGKRMMQIIADAGVRISRSAGFFPPPRSPVVPRPPPFPLLHRCHFSRWRPLSPSHPRVGR